MQIVASVFLKMYYDNIFFILRSIVASQEILITILNYGIKIGKGVTRIGKLLLWGSKDKVGCTCGDTSPY